MATSKIHKQCRDVIMRDWKWVLCTENQRPDPFAVKDPEPGTSPIQILPDVKAVDGWKTVTCQKCLKAGGRA